MPDFPELGSGTVHGRFLAGTLDSSPTINPLADGPAPDAEPLGGSVTFTATAPLLLVTSAAPDPVSFFPQPLTVELDSEGYLSRNGSRDIQLWATNDPQGNPIDWQWHVHFSLTYKGRGVYRQPFNFFLPEGTIVDLTVVAPLIELSNGTIIIQGPPGESASDLINAQGDLITGDIAGDAAILPVGAAGSYLAPEPTAPLGLEWKPLPIPEAGLKEYADLAEAEAVRISEIGTVFIPVMSAAFPNLVSQNFDTFKASGAANLIITTTVSDALSPNQAIKECVQEFHIRSVGSEYPDVLRVARMFQFNATSGVTIPTLPLWQVLADLPGTGYRGVAVTDPFGMWWAISGFPDSALIGDQNGNWKAVPSASAPTPSSVMKRDAEGQAQIADPTGALDIVNVRYLESVVATVPIILTGSGAPDDSLGDDGDFYIDIDTGTIYGPKHSTEVLEGPPNGYYPSGIPLEFGVQFSVAEAGTVSAVRLIESRIAEGVALTVALWDSAGLALGTGSAVAGAYRETVDVPLAVPVEIVAGQTYTASLTSPAGETVYGDFTWPVTGGQGVTLIAAVSGNPGVFPPNAIADGNYWVEPVFLTTGTEVWPVAVAPGAPAGGGLKRYATIEEAMAERETAVGILHVDNVAVAFPQVDPLHRVWGSTGPGDFIFETSWSSQGAPPALNVVYWQRVSGADYAGVWSTAFRVWQGEVGDAAAGQQEQFKLDPQSLPELPAATLNSVLIGVTGGNWGKRAASSEAGYSTLAIRASNGSLEAYTNAFSPNSLVNVAHFDTGLSQYRHVAHYSGAVAFTPEDGGKLFRLTNTDPSEITVGTPATFPVGFWIDFVRTAAESSVVAADGSIILSVDGKLSLDPFVTTRLTKLHDNDWHLDVSPAASTAVPPHTHPELGGTRRFLFDATPGGDPGPGHISIENAGGQNRLLRISKTDADGNAVSLAPLAVNDSVALSHEVSPPTIYARGYAASLATDAVTHWEFTAVRESGTGALPAEGTALILSIAMANGGGSSVPAGLPVYATMAELNAVVTGEVGVLHVDSLMVAFPGLALVNQTFAADGPADLVVTSSLSDQPSGAAGMSDLLQTFEIIDANNSLRPLRVWRYIRVDTAAGAATQTGSWSLVNEYTWPATTLAGDMFVGVGGKNIGKLAAAITDGQVLTADLAQNNRMRWKTPIPAPLGVYDWLTVTGGTYTPDPQDAGVLFNFLNPGPITVLLPAVGFPNGAQVHFMQKAATGPITFTSDGVLFAPGGKTVLAGQYSKATATKLGYSEWLIEGDLAVP